MSGKVEVFLTANRVFLFLVPFANSKSDFSGVSMVTGTRRCLATLAALSPSALSAVMAFTPIVFPRPAALVQMQQRPVFSAKMSSVPRATQPLLGPVAIAFSRGHCMPFREAISRAKQVLVRAALSFLLVFGGMSLVRPATCHAENSRDCSELDAYGQEWQCSASRAAVPAPLVSVHGHRLAFAWPGQDSVHAGVSPGHDEWRGMIGELRLGNKIEKLVTGWSNDFREWLKFQSYELLANNPAVKLLVFTLGSALLVAMGAWMLLAAEGSPKADWWYKMDKALFKSYALLMNVAGADATSEETGRTALVVNVIFLMGCLSFAILLGVVTSTIESALDEALSGTHKVVARDHIVMINWGDKSGPMLKQMESSVQVQICPLMIIPF